jgi:hypothetical protein
VPVPPDWVSPSGRLYAYPDYTTHKIRVVTVSDGNSGDVTGPGSWELIGVDESGVYVVTLGTPGVSFITFGGAKTQVVDRGTWLRFGSRALWGVDQSGNIARHDLSTGAETIWGKAQSISIFAGFYPTGEPIVDTGGALAIYHSNGSSTAIWPGTNGLSAGGRVAVDTFGVWFEVGGGLAGAPGHGVYLWSDAKGPQLISAPEVHIAGGCTSL